MLGVVEQSSSRKNVQVYTVTNGESWHIGANNITQTNQDVLRDI